MLPDHLRFAVRQLLKNPGFALAVTLTLALGVGVNAAVFTLVNGFLLRPLPYPEPDRLGVLVLHAEGISEKTGQLIRNDNPSQDGTTWELVRNSVSAARVASFGGTSGINLQAGSGSNTSIRYVQNMRVSADYFSVLGVQPFLGRGFSQEEDRPGGPKARRPSFSARHSGNRPFTPIRRCSVSPPSSKANLTQSLESCGPGRKSLGPPISGRHFSLMNPESAEERTVKSFCAFSPARPGSRSQRSSPTFAPPCSTR